MSLGPDLYLAIRAILAADAMPLADYLYTTWRVARVDYWGGLENRWSALNRRVGSNPTLSVGELAQW